MGEYEILDHRADLKIKIVGKDKEEIFQEAMKAMTDYLSPGLQKKKVEREIEVESIDLGTLLVDFLNEVLYFYQVEKEAYFGIKFIDFKDNFLRAILKGNKVRNFKKEIKAATYHNLEIKKRGEFLEAVVLFDI